MERDNRTFQEILQTPGTEGEKYAKIVSLDNDKKSSRNQTYHVLNVNDGFSSTRLFLWSETHSLSPGDIIKFSAESVNSSFLSTKSVLKTEVSEEDAINSVITEFNVDIKKFIQEVNDFVDLFVTDERFVLFIKYLMNEAYLKKISDYPAAKAVHHSLKGGLLKHMEEMFDIYRALAGTKVCCNLKHEYVIIGIMFHDFFKFKEYDISNPATKRTKESYLLGHIFLGANFISKAFQQFEASTGNEFDNLEKAKAIHTILAHHGTQEWGSPVTPSTKEAQVLHYIDQISAKLNMFDFTGDLEENKFLSTAHIR